MTVRQLAIRTILKVKESAYSDAVLARTIEENDLSGQDSAFLSRLTYGVIERCRYLDFLIERQLTGKIEKLSPEILAILECGVYQLYYMDSVPDRAAVDESVKLAAKFKQRSASGLVNAVLRGMIRAGKPTPRPLTGNLPADLGVYYSVSDEVANVLLRYGDKEAEEILTALSKIPRTYLKLNKLVATEKELLKKLGDEGVKIQKTDLFGCFSYEGILHKTDAFSDGLCYIQDKASQLAMSAAVPKASETVMDLCSAPGGKSFFAGIEMENCGKILAMDLYEHRTEKIEEGAKRLHIDIIEARSGDSAKFDASIGRADLIICDVPCSGLGVIAKKPEIRYKKLSDIEELIETQKRLITNAAKYMKEGGRILYSTCTLNPAENSEVVNWFCGKNPLFKRVEEKTLFPELDECDGFYYCLLEK